MNKKLGGYWLVGLLLFLAIAGTVGWNWWRQTAKAPVQAKISGIENQTGLDDYERVTEPRKFVFPSDHGPHPEFLTEWWYYTGNLQDGEGRRFGYQLTFFRRAVQPPNSNEQRSSEWAADQVYMAHLAVTDVRGEAFQAFERFERGAAGLAGAQANPQFRVWVRDWAVEQVTEGEYRMRASEGNVSLDLSLSDKKGIILQGDQGYSQKGPEQGNASLYYSQPRLATEGSIAIGGRLFQVTGTSWLDREISTSALSPGQVGWDWFALQLEDGSELMAYVLRRADGKIDAFSTGTLIQPDGTTVRLELADYEIQALDRWRSPHSGGNYPAKWQLRIPSQQIVLVVEPLVADQELNLSFTYWEGAVGVTGEKNDQPISGFGYVELTGYANSLEGGL